MNVLAICLLIVTAIVSYGFVGVIQGTLVFALMKAEDPDAGGEIRAPSGGGALKSILPPSGGATLKSTVPSTPSTNDEKTKPSIAQKVIPGIIISPSTVPQLYKVKVTFTSVTVHNSHEGVFSGDGEYDLNAYVHGKLVSLTDMSRKTGASGLWDVSSGETVRFPPGSEITVDIDKNLPLSILTVGSEIDECGRTSFPSDLQPQIVSLLTNNWVGQTAIKAVNTLNPLGGIQDQIDKAINYVGCKLNKNDDIGDIVRSYDAVGYGTGPHFDKSDAGDFSLAYTITVLPR